MLHNISIFDMYKVIWFSIILFFMLLFCFAVVILVSLSVRVSFLNVIMFYHCYTSMLITGKQAVISLSLTCQFVDKIRSQHNASRVITWQNGYIILLGCYTWFSCTLIDWYLQMAKITLRNPFTPFLSLLMNERTDQ